MSSSYIQPPVPTPVNEEDHSENPDLDPDQANEGDNPETADPDVEPDLPPVGDASGIGSEGDAGPGGTVAGDRDSASGTEDAPVDTAEDTPLMDAAMDESEETGSNTSPDSSDGGTDARTDSSVAGEESAEAEAASGSNTSAATDTSDPDAAGAEVGMTEGDSYFEPEEDPEGHKGS